MSGDKIVSSNIGKVEYKVQIMEDIKLEGDPNYPCIDYKLKGDYAKCIENEMLQENFKYLNCTPPWMTKDEDLWCNGKYELLDLETKYNYDGFLAEVGAGLVKVKKCLPPCKEKTYQATEMGLRRKTSKGLIIWFENEVDITKSSWKVDAVTIISNIGGFIGIGKEFLWLVILLLTILLSIIKQNILK